jgi:DNA-binding NarL/FixJ family response regulator
MKDEISVLIADDHPLLRRGLRHTIECDPTLKVVAEAGDGETALAQVLEMKPRIALLDIDMPKLDGLTVGRQLRVRRLPTEILFLSIHNAADLFQAAMEIGAKGYLLKDIAVTEVVKALHAVAAGEYYVTPSLAGHLVHHQHRIAAFAERQPGLETLTPTERRILLMVAEGKSSKTIGEELFVHYRTVENHRTNICQKLSLHGPNALFRFALQHKTDF